jgi:hypothetical protein
MDTYGVDSSAEHIHKVNSITSADLQRTAGRLFSDGAYASVVVGNSELVKTQLEPLGKVEVMGAINPKPEKTTGPDKPKPAVPSKPE